MTPTVLIVDDQPDQLASVARILKGGGYEVELAASGVQALEVLSRGSIDLVLSDVTMPEMDGLQLLSTMRKQGDRTPTIMASGKGTIEVAMQAIKLGALDFVEKPLTPERLTLTVGNALRYLDLAEAHTQLRADLESSRELIGSGAAMQRLRGLIGRVAPSDGRVLIVGENGVGKELVAAAIHAGSPRKPGPFVKLNCGAVPENLVESELFGHEKGAFTGAVTARKGRFELADRGTLFLDEIGDMPLPMQVKLLRVLQEGQFERVGGTRTFTVDVRVIAATNKDLQAMVEDGDFREDLYYRLNVVTLPVPSLRERLDDVPELVKHLAQRSSARGLQITDEAYTALREYDFPGNVRELHNLVERLNILYGDEVIGRSQVEEVLPVRRRRKAKAGCARLYEPGRSLKEIMRDVERRVLLEAIEVNGNSKTSAARALGTERSHFYKKCRQLDIGD